MTIFAGIVLLGVIAFSFSTATAVDQVIVGGYAHETMNAGEDKAFRFMFQQRNSVRLRFKTNTSLELDMNIDVENIGDKDITIEVNCSEEVLMNMTCNETQAELGLLNGNTIQTRSQNRYRYNYGFMTNISINCTDFKARLSAQVGNVQGYTWAYWNDTEDAWEEVETNLVDGEAVADVDHFSTWTLLSPDNSIGIETIGLFVIGFLAVGIMLVLYRYKKKR